MFVISAAISLRMYWSLVSPCIVRIIVSMKQIWSCVSQISAGRQPAALFLSRDFWLP